MISATAKELERLIRMGWVSPEGIIWNEELAGSQGMDFILFPAKHHTKEDIEATEHWLQNSRDAVSITIGKFEGHKYPWPKKIPVLTPEQREAGFRQIVATKTFQPLEDCVGVDLYTAQQVVQIIDSISPKNKAWLLKHPASRIISLVWQALEETKEK